MALYSQSIKNFVQGVSQQPDFIRFPEQLAEQINGFSTEVDGLQKRPPTVFLKILADLQQGSAENLQVHFVNRDKYEQYMMVFTNQTIYIYDLQGNEKTVNCEGNAKDYIDTLDPLGDLQIITVADYTFVLNKTQIVKMTSNRSPAQKKECMVVVKGGHYASTYTINDKTFITPDGSNASHIGSIKVDNIAYQLAIQFGGAAAAMHNVVYFPNASSVSTSDSTGGDDMVFIYNTVSSFTDLPYYAPKGFTVKVAGDPNGSSAGSYYVKYNSSNNLWEECPAPNMLIKINPNTMPHALVRNGDGTFTLKTLEWDDRKVGDDDSNPLPSFIDNTLSSLFFYRNRLGVSSKENIILSESASYYNYWMSTANALLDTDCIDVPVTSTKSNIINYMCVYMEDLYAFSTDTQFVMKSDTALTPKTASPVELTQFNNSPDCQPVVTGKNLYFATERGRYTSIKEYYTMQDVSAMKNAQDISSHISNYIPKGVYEIIPSTTENVLLCLTADDPTTIYIYKYLFNDTSRVQASWSKWKFGKDICGAGFIGNKLYMLFKKDGVFSFEVLDFSTNIKDYDSEPYRIMLDQKQDIKGGVFDDVYEQTSFDIAGSYGVSTLPLDTIDIVDSNGVYYPSQPLVDGKVILEGNKSSLEIFVGLPYTFAASLSTFFVRQSNANGNGSSTVYTDGRTQVKYVNLQYDSTGYLEVAVRPAGGQSFTYKMTGIIMGVSAELGEPRSNTGIFRFPVHAKNTEVTINIESSYPVPLSLVGLTWECLYTTKTRKV